jgi:hypothetical protein
VFRRYLSFKFGNVPVEEIFKSIFILGLIPIVLLGIFSIFGIDVGITNLLSYRNGDGVVFDPGLVLSGFVSLFFVLIIIVAWKLTCELLYLVFKSLEVFIKKNG